MFPPPSRTLALALIAFALVAAPPLCGQGGDEPAARRLLSQASQLEARGDLPAAARELRLVRDQFPGTTSATEALLAEARIHHRLGDLTAARRVARELVDGWGRSLAAAGGLVLLAELDLATSGTRESLEQVRTQFARIPLLFGPEVAARIPARTRARVHSGLLSLRFGEVDRAVGQLLAAAEDEPASEATGEARLALARAFLIGGHSSSAAWWGQRLVDEPTQVGTKARQLLAQVERLEARARRGLPAWRSVRRLTPSGLDASRGLMLAASSEGTLLVADDRAGARELGPDGEVLRSINATDVVAVTWAFDGSGWLVAPSGLLELGGGRRLVVTNPDDSSKTLDRIADAAPDPWGGWYVLDSRRDRVVRADGSGQSRGVVAGIPNRPIAIASDPLGRLYVLDRRAGTVSRVDHQGGASVVVRGGWRDPLDLAVDPAGRIAVLDGDGPRVLVYGADGTALLTQGANLPGGVTLSRPTSIALDAAGRLAIADRRAAALLVLE